METNYQNSLWNGHFRNWVNVNKFLGQKSEMKEMNLVQVSDDDQTVDQQLTATDEETSLD